MECGCAVRSILGGGSRTAPWSLDIFSIQDKRVPIAVGIIFGVGVGIGIGIEGQKMGFEHEKPGTGNASRKALLDRIVAMLTKLG
jgi:hypothetical protein